MSNKENPHKILVQDKETKKEVYVSERSWNISLKNTKMKNGNGLRYVKLKTKSPKSKENEEGSDEGGK